MSPSTSNYNTIPNNGHTTIYMGHPSVGFDTKSIREAFVSKVFGILSVQLIFACLLISAFTFHQPTKVYFQQNGSWWLMGASLGGLVIMMILTCCEGPRRRFPINFVLLFGLTLAYGLVAAILSAQYDTVTVLTAFLATAVATLSIAILAKICPFDLTACGCALCVLSLIHLLLFVVYLLVLVPLGYAKIGALVIASLGAFLVSLYLVFDLQMIMGGRSGELSPEEYILGAALLYVDILMLFQYLLFIIGAVRD